MKSKITRREFVKKCGTAGAVLALPTIVPSSVFGAGAPSNRITIGCIGTGKKGLNNIKSFMAKSDAQIVALCDVDASHLKDARTKVGLDSRSTYKDFRKLLERKDIDAVVITTPDHWHVPISIAAAKAGKDIYCEKPLSLNIAEGRTLCDVVKRYGRILQTGSQQRSDNEFRFGCELVRNGRIGKLQTIDVQIPANNKTCPPTWQAEPIPAGFDYDSWLGPAPWAPYTQQRCHYTFRFILDYSGGQVTNFGAHHLDIAQWGNDTDNTGPVEIKGTGQFPKSGLFNTATNVNVEYSYANGVKLFLKTGTEGTIKFKGSDGWVSIKRGRIVTSPESLVESKIKPSEIHLYNSRNHAQNFLNCIKTRRDPITSVETGHRSATLCHLGNIAMLLGRTLKWDPAGEKFINDDQADRMRKGVS